MKVRSQSQGATLRSPRADESAKNFESSHKQKKDEMISNFENVKGARQQIVMHQIEERMKLIDEDAVEVQRALSDGAIDEPFDESD